MVKLGDNRNPGSNVTVGLGDNHNFISDVMFGLRSNVTVSIRGYCKGLVVPTSRSYYLRDPLLFPTLRSDEVLFAT